ncbi:MAG: efflux RND transporter periplasmic adaptor subunit [bacterium]|nr:efflux RND transporter periplasmic adaptor subunit [bacterium]
MVQQTSSLRPRRLWILPLIAVGMAVVLAGWWWLQQSAPKASPWLSVPVTRQNIADTVQATGTIRAAKLVNVGTQATGQVQALHVRVGDRVQAGELIAEIDATTQNNTLRDEIASQQSIMAQQKARQAALDYARQNLKRQQSMYAKDAGSLAELQAAQNALAAAEAELRINATQLQQAAIKIETARANLGYTRIVAPMAGTVVALITEEGQTVNSAMSTPTIVKLAQLDTVLIEAQISEADVTRLKPGMPAYFTLLGDPHTRYPTELHSVDLIPADQVRESSSAGPAPTSQGGAIYYNGRLHADNTAGTLRVAMTAQVVITVAGLNNVLVVPAAALGTRAADGRYAVRVLEEGRKGEELIHKKVRIGLNNRVYAQVLEGLQEGEQVVVGKVQTDQDMTAWTGSDAGAAP